MSKHKKNGTEGENEIIELIVCPNCNSKLMLLPDSFPLEDVQCTRCRLRIQVKTSRSKPKSQVRGSGYDIYDKVAKAGYLAPPIIVYFKWSEDGQSRKLVLFYPFIPKDNIRPYTIGPKAKRANYKMFNYIGLNNLPHFVLFKNY